MDYPGKVITKTQVTPTQTSASGNWTLDDQAAAIKNNNWPVALVPNPISKSLRFNSADSAYLNRTPSSGGNRQKFTMSAWAKRGSLGGTQNLINVHSSVSGADGIRLDSDKFNFYLTDASNAAISTTAVFRDPSAWYHFVCAVDTTQATASNRVRMYVNGVEQTSFSTANYPSQNFNTSFNEVSRAHSIGRNQPYNNEFFNGYLTEFNWVDGQQLTPSSFGMTNPQTGQWIPLKYSGTYGTNGFYLNFKDATSTTTLGYDYSGNANNWTTNNFSVTAGSGNDSLTDVPTPWVAYNTTGDVGGVVRGNYCTWNPFLRYSALTAPANGNLDISGNNANWRSILGTIAATSGKWYAEFTVQAAGADMQVGVFDLNNSAEVYQICNTDNRNLTRTASGYAYQNNAKKVNNNTETNYGATYTTNDVIGIALDLDGGTITFYKNGSSQGQAYSSLSGNFTFGVSTTSSNVFNANFGQRPFAYTPPTGFRSLCTTNLPATAIGFGLTNQGDDYFNTVIYTGTGSTRTVTGVGFQPDFLWIKERSEARDHALFDAVRGAGKYLFSNTTDAEDTATSMMSAFTSDGFTVGASSYTNANTQTYVSWNWKASGSTVSNTAGTITSTVSANTTAGFSIVTYTGTGSNATVGHGLGVAPSMIFIKWRTGGTTQDWIVYHASIGATKFLELNTTDAEATSSTRFNDTAPSSTVFTLGTNSTVNASTYTYVAYCFAAVPGYSAFGSYTGNGNSDGPFIYTGFRPKFVLHKCSSLAGDGWLLYDTVRQTYNVVGAYLQPNLSNAEGNTTVLDILSNGFKLRSTFSSTNSNGATYIYMAFAESPFQFSNAR